MANYIDRQEVIETLAFYREDPDGIDHALNSIKSIPSADASIMEWIPVNERLPDFEGMCLCMRKSYSKAKFRHQEIMYFDFDEQRFMSNVDGIFVADGNVTHWMPLPKPPVPN